MTIPLGTGIGLATSRQAGSPPFSPADLFTGGVEGAWYDISDRSTLFQNAAGTIPVVADGDPVGLVKDKSGNGRHLKQTTGGDRPLYRANAGGSPFVEFTGSSYMSGDRTIPYSSSATDLYLGVQTRPRNDFSFPALFLSADNSHTAGIIARKSTFGWTSIYIFNNSINWIKDNLNDTNVHWGDFRLKQNTGSVSSTDLDIQVDGVIGQLYGNSSPTSATPFNWGPAIRTVDGSTPIAASEGEFYGGVFALRAMTQADRNNLRGHFSRLR